MFTAGTENTALYWMLMITIVFSCIKFLHEWIHYFYITVPPTPKLDKLFTVDIFTTFCAGEPYDMIEETLIAIKAITYPHQTFLCDESDDPYLKAFCKDLGIFHVTRVKKINAKAGNINNALQSSSAELCVVLDPDHVPYPNFLDPIVSHFNDPKVGYVQIVQSYRNHDQSLIAKGAAQQTFQFYGPIMMTMNKYGTVLAIGANCTFRRSALDSIGGHAAGLAEDMHTAMQLHAKGWKSIYVPAVLARGLVPSTLSAYYAQQLKWSRGVFELLVTSYIKLFKKFTWQQKLHYGVIPLHYLSGVIMLLNFLIPILCLFFNISPIDMDFSKFITLALPLSTFVILIRHFVQKWVMEEEERGFHVIGGLLLIGTWWVFMLGLFYTILRKKVPYIPTPKDDKEKNLLRLNIPNFLLIILSLIAIVYGLHNDWNPFNLIMAGFAAINCLILLFTIVASSQFTFRRYKNERKLLTSFMLAVKVFKIEFWKFRRLIYKGMRSTALLLSLLILSLTGYRMNSKFSEPAENSYSNYRKNILIPGIFAPEQDGGLTSLDLVRKYESQSKIHFGIISFYIAWGDQPQCNLPFAQLDQAFKQNAIPMVTWEPWQSLFDRNDTLSDKLKENKVFSRILNGDYDGYLDKFSKQVKSLNRPIFIRFAHEADNPQYPWSAAGGNTADDFKEGWQYVHDYFLKHQVRNVIWVWNPWKPEAVAGYFPGKEYVDWLGVTNLNYATKNSNRQSYSSEQLYLPFHQQAIFTSGLPVMFAEMGSLETGKKRIEWLQDGVRNVNKYPEVKALVIFNSGIDKNSLDTRDLNPLDWRINNFTNMELGLLKMKKEQFWLSNQLISQQPQETLSAAQFQKTIVNRVVNKLIKGVNYFKTQNWYTNGHALKVEEIRQDISEMKEIGVNSIKYSGPGIYDHNVLNVARELGMGVVYSFRTPDHVNYFSDTEILNKFADKILETVSSKRDDKNIMMWNIGNTPLTEISNNYFKPDLFYPRARLIEWLKKLVHDIKTIDPDRDISLDVDADQSLIENAAMIHYNIPEIDMLGLIVGASSNTIPELKTAGIPYFISKIDAADYLDHTDDQSATFISAWQDETNENNIAFNGLKDHNRQDKYEFYKLGQLWAGLKLPEELPLTKILLPAVTVLANTNLVYSALIFKDSWLIPEEKDKLMFKWEMVKLNKYGHPVQVLPLGEGSTISVKIPEHPASYNLYLYITKGKQVKIVKSALNTPLY